MEELLKDMPEHIHNNIDSKLIYICDIDLLYKPNTIMKKIIILCYDFPPLNSIGAQRPFSWFKHFKSYGLYPIVITTDWSNEKTNQNIIQVNNNGEIHYTLAPKYTVDRLFSKSKLYPMILFRKMFTYLNAYLKFSISGLEKTKNIFQYANKFIQNNDIDYILASGEPFILFKYGHKLSTHYKIPWFADYRDDWIFDHGRINNGILDSVLMKYESYFEKKYLRSAAGYISVSKYIMNDIDSRVDCNNKIIIENGVELDYLENGKVILDKKTFNIVYTGRFYESSYMKIFINGFKKFMESEKKIKVKVYFVGIEKSKCTPYFDVLSLEKEYPKHIEIINSVDIQTATNYQLSASVLLNFIPGDPSKGLIGAKACPYAATRKPTLLIPEIPSKNSPFFPNRNIQNIAINGLEVFEFLNDKYNQFYKNKNINTDISDEEIFKLSRKYNAKKLANFITNHNLC